MGIVQGLRMPSPTWGPCLLLRRGAVRLLGSDPGTLLGDGTLHQQHTEHERDHDNRQHPEHIEVGERRRLLRAQFASDCNANCPAATGSPV